MSYGRLNERKIKETDYILSCQQTRQELNQYIDEESKRVNVDSAKKRAVLQRKFRAIQIWITKAFVKWFWEQISSPLKANKFTVLRRGQRTKICQSINTMTKRKTKHQPVNPRKREKYRAGQKCIAIAFESSKRNFLPTIRLKKSRKFYFAISKTVHN